MAHYQIDRIDPQAGRPDMEYKMMQAASAKQALTDYLTGKGYVLDDQDAPVTIGWEKINGTRTMTARCPADTSAYWTAKKVSGASSKDIMLPARIRKARESAGLTQTEAAKKAGCTQQVWAQYEGGLVDPTVTRLTAIAKALNVSPGSLLD